ncbi:MULTISPECIES: GxxExxY protein [Clostridium]|uniref:GxxExxY protein n=1 Tax=Clostridium aquiflavi TaxID=3073603 RepID=A0ABU1EGC5_9CLOT|nr:MULTISPECIES: GxxExxY protein [unclassified Clostridium]MDR5587405.1 GxxExxY protein [Clostridium sp. 5N-1]NFG62906.1 AAA family ATPase [Clostridium botulinum]NFQ08711.1 AAA family ATPase [Clostridium botulinum]
MEEYLEFFDEYESDKKNFNTAGLCIETKHYMVNVDNKIKNIIKLIQNDSYFVINRPRQYGKTTILSRLEKILKTRYKVVSLDFEGLGNVFESEQSFCRYFINHINSSLELDLPIVFEFLDLINIIKEITNDTDIILIIDEVDKASNNKLFLDFLGMLRSLYLSRAKGDSNTFKSVILAGVHDIKNLKIKFRDATDIKYNSPWNIAVKFDVDMSFNEYEIGTMLSEYSDENKLNFHIENLSKEIYKFTSGYPFLVSRICQIIDENILINRDTTWNKIHIQKAIKILLQENNTLFDDLIKNMENNNNLYEYLYNLLILNVTSIFNIDNPIINLGVMFGYLSKDENNNTIVSNKIIRERIYNYLVSKTDSKIMSKYNFKDNFITENNGLHMEKILLRFQQFMKENYSTRDTEFLERQGVLLFLSFIKPIINGVGFDYKEVQISEERRLDIVIQYNHNKYVIETKIWHGDIAHQKGLKQLKNYLDIEGLDKGYLLIFNFNKNKEYINEKYSIDKKEIFEVIV